MNVIQANTSLQTNAQQESGHQDPGAIMNKEFEGHLSSAKQHVEWFTEENIGSEKKRIQKEQIEKRRYKDEKEDEVMEEVASSALKNDVKTENELQKSSHLKVLGTENKVLDIQNGNSILKEKVDSDRVIKNTTVEIGQKKVDQKNPHFVQPATEPESGPETREASFSNILSNYKNTHQQTSPSTLSSLTLSGETVGADQQKKLDSTSRVNHTQNLIEKGSDPTKIQGLKAKADLSSIQNRSAYQKQNSLSEFSQSGKASEKTPTNKGMEFSNEIQRAAGKENQVIEKNTKMETKDFSKAEKTNAKEIAGNLKIMLSAKKDEMTVNLAPEHLGKLEIKLKKNGDKMSGVFMVESKEAEEMLKSQFSQLRASLEDQGIKIDDFTVILKDEYSAALSNSSSDGQAQQRANFEQSERNEVRVNEDVQIDSPVIQSAGSNESGLNIYA